MLIVACFSFIHVYSSNAEFCVFNCGAEISFKSIPEGALVRDERLGDLGVTPFVKMIPKGSNLDLTYTLKGYEDVKKSYYNISSTMIAMMEMIKKPTRIYVRTNPPGALTEIQTTDGLAIQYNSTSRIEGRQDSATFAYEVPDNIKNLVVVPVSYTHLTLPTIYSV